jgi:hypothetical protein
MADDTLGNREGSQGLRWMPQDPRHTTPEGFDWDRPVNLSVAPDLGRCYEAWLAADSYDARMDKDDYSVQTSLLLWYRANEVFAEEHGLPIPTMQEAIMEQIAHHLQRNAVPAMTAFEMDDLFDRANQAYTHDDSPDWPVDEDDPTEHADHG